MSSEAYAESFLKLDATKDLPHVSSEWSVNNNKLIQGVVVREVKNILKGNGHLAELYRKDWKTDDLGVDQIFMNVLDGGGTSGWHAHAKSTDRLFVVAGSLRLGLWDGRDDSPTKGRGMDVYFGERRPMLIVIPPGVWHAVKNESTERAIMVNAVHYAYDYADPDHFRLPFDTDRIPVRLNGLNIPKK